MSSQVVIITGAASGIGAAIALSFAKLHAELCITDINEQELHKTGIECKKLSKNKVLEVVADITKDEDTENIVKSTIKELGRIDVLINCAGIYISTSLEDPDIIETYDNIFKINLRSVVDMTKKALPSLIESKGCVINISSIGSTVIVNNNLIYSMSKAGVTTFTKCAAFELAKKGVRVNCISPGAVRTNLLKNSGISELESNKFWDNSEESTPMKKLAAVEEVAEMAVYLASDKAASITGSDIVIDAGLKLGVVAEFPTLSGIQNNVI